ncbi:PTS system trehalose-specific EIIBC component [Staphylococcus pseudoxylosus]|uniref:PTS system trehalose-specific EIIBC component n=1 Tax=Staphylococcus pseudoxylosus TaxID=2282419 RepID=UPI000D1D1D19|nr:PTS system trehalose-specific EIIBC component [Staphylococcus pseudoxylosus]PTI44537.1 PTS trehalose transporter subunit IIBC [Staphylococcus xylosus]MDW8797178.1 PTS system trehalose-specific EIIBC component [Staphylococcus pseudoxylosus]MEB6036210.1 PTS system trehalose-specific EIIBC component [Staphylococcus pseudoxylosus]MEB6044705.1 PTS system trehalose-specific EIIBC component [Staphylococcus pseudoxylosus]MEB6060965.1 PTS system trehalose-specific EIIBC component [Staphylococcus pse
MAVKKKDVQDIVEAVGGKDNLDTATHCVTRLRLVLKDDDKVDKDRLSNNDLVKGQFKADNQYQIVIGPGTVDEVYKQLIAETGISESSKDDAKAAAAKKGNPIQRLIKLLGDIFIPILPAIVTAGLLMGINNLLTMEDLFGSKPLVEQFPQLGDISNIINVIASTAFIFLPALIGWSSMRVFGGSQILGLVLGLILMNPQLVSQYDIAKGNIPTWDIFGLEIKQLNYQGQVLPILLAAYVLAQIEKFLNKHIHDSIKMLVVGPIALLITGFLAFIVIGPVALWLGTGITNGVTFVFEHAGWLGGAIYGLLYAPLVITGLHHMFLAVDFQLMGSELGGTYLWPILAISNICQGSAAFGAWFVYRRRKMGKEQGLAMTSGVSGFLGVTEPALFGVNLPLKYPFVAAISTSCVLGAIIGATRVLGSVGVGGVPAFISIKSEYWGIYLVCTFLAIVVPAILTVFLSKFSKDKAKEMVEE